MLSVIESSDANFQQHWHTLFENDPLQNPLYESRAERIVEDGGEDSDSYTDRSFVVVSQDKPVFGCSLTVHTDAEGRKCLGYFGLDAYTHVNKASLSKPSNNFSPEAIRLLQQHIYQLLEEERPETLDFLDPVSCGVMSPMTEVLLQQGARPTVHKVQVIDLSKPSEVLLAAVSPAYREILTQAQGRIRVNVVYSDKTGPEPTLEQANFSDTNAANYYEDCLELLKQGQGFLIQAEQQDKLLASALCVYSRRTCQFVFGESFSGTGEQSVLPVLAWRAIQEAKALGCGQFDFGFALDNEAIIPLQFGGIAHTRLKISL